MATSSSSSSSENLKISLEEIKLFYTIDRDIFARLVLHLGRDPSESMHVMALLLWLEYYSSHTRNLVCDIQPWPDTLIDELADEAVECLNCLKSGEFPFSLFGEANFIIPLTRKLTNNEVSLRFFHDNRIEIMPGIVQLVHDICVRAFDDIMQQALGLINPTTAEQDRIEQNLEPLRFYDPLIRQPLRVCNYNNSAVGDFGDQNIGFQQISRPNTNTGDLGFFHGLDPNDLSLRAQRKSPNNESMEDLLDRIPTICINSLEGNNTKEVAADRRTIFLTFSRGYPISEDEVRDFFTRKLGENLVGVEMQEVPEWEQPLYAKLVLISASALELILNGQAKAKYSINGKHVWARKFVPEKSSKSPPRKFKSKHLQHKLTYSPPQNHKSKHLQRKSTY